MKMKTVATCSPMLLCLVAGAARADLEPFSFQASETVQHQSNILHTDDTEREGDWLSTTELKAALDQAIGRERLLADASIDVDRYAKLHKRSSNGYTASGQLDWSTIGDLSGSFGADSRRHQYLTGVEGELGSISRNLQTDNHAFARIQLGGLARWSLFSGFDASQRKYSDPAFDVNELQQWAVSGGSSYATSPDLSFGVQGRYVRGKYPKALLPTGAETFSVKTAGVNTKWTASGNSAFDANIGYTEQRTDGQPDQHFINGGLNWRWTPPSHFTVTLGVSRDSNSNVGLSPTLINTNGSVNARSLNTTGHLDVGYELTAKVGLDFLAQYIHRKYSNALVPTDFIFDGTRRFDSVTGASNSSRFGLSAHYAPSRTTTLTCGFSREIHAADETINKISQSFTDNTVQCTAAIRFD